MREHKHLSDVERDTLQRLAGEFGMEVIADHTGLKTRAINRALMPDGSGVTPEEYEAITGYLSAHV